MTTKDLKEMISALEETHKAMSELRYVLDKGLLDAEINILRAKTAIARITSQNSGDGSIDTTHNL